MQSLQRSVRRLARHRLMAGIGGLMLQYTHIFAGKYAFVGHEPRFVVPRLHRLVRSALRQVDEEMVAPRRTFNRYMALIQRGWRLQSGIFCGRLRPGDACAICQRQESGRCGGEWWWAMRCDHRFHVGCMFAYFAHDTRCPLCRVDLC